MSEIIEMPYGTGKTVGIWRTICLPSYPPQYRYECSKCHSQVKEPSKSCPNCKAEMKFFPEDFFKAYTEVQLDAEIDKEDLQSWKVKMTENKFKLEMPKPCPFCGKRELTFFRDSIIQCCTCGTVFIHPFSKDEKSKTIFEIWQIRSNEQ